MSFDAGASSGEQQRSKRQKVDKSSKFERLKQLKGSKNKYEIGDVDSVYDLVDEQEYAKRYSDVSAEKWIVDDGTGYVEDGRDIFDDEDEADTNQKDLTNEKKKKSKKKLSDLQSAAISTGSDIRGLIAKMPQVFDAPKAKNTDVDVNALLDNLLSEEDANETLDDNRRRKVTLLEQMENEKRAVNSYMGSYNVDQGFVIARKKVSVRSKNVSTPKRKLNEIDTITVDEEPGESSMNETTVREEIVATEEPVDDRANLSESIFESCDFPSPEMVVGTSETVTIETNETEKEQNLSDIMDDYDFDIGDNSLEQEEERAAAVQAMTADDLDEPMENDANTVDENDSEIFHFYWLDAYEDAYLAPGTIFLFGRCRLPRLPNRQSIAQYESCCVIIKNIRKTVYFLPGENVNRDDLIEEIDLTVFNSKLAQTNYRFVQKKYVFDSSVPIDTEYLQVDYPATFESIDGSRTGHNFRRIFGANQTCMERFLLQRRFRGPCWLQLKNAQKSTNKTSHCKHELIVDSEDFVEISDQNSKLNLPTIVSLTFDCFLLQNPKTLKPEIAMISCIFDKKFSLEKSSKLIQSREYFCAFTKPSHKSLPVDLPKTDIEINRQCKFVQLSSERSLISCFLAKLTQYDPDIIIGHDLFGYKINILCDRIRMYSMPNWSFLGRLNRTTKIQKLQTFHLYKTAMIGRLICDLKTAAKDSNLKCRSYDLTTLSQTILRSGSGAAAAEARQQQLHSDTVDLNMYVIEKLFSNATAIVQLMHKLITSADLIVRLIMEIKAVPLALQITKIAGNVMSTTLQGGRSERNEFLLLHAFFDSGFIVPDRQKKKTIGSSGGGGGGGKENEAANDASNESKQQSYEGGLVLQPKIGLYDSFILLMDFNSLYPSIIQEFNICFTTMAQSEGEAAAPSSQQLGILPLEIQRLVEARKQVKRLLKASKLSDEMRLQYNIRQMALKLTANSMYGCLGFGHSRFYAKHLAAKITQRGREILMNTRDLAERHGYEVIYGDTDSIMINTNTQDIDSVNKIAAKLKTDINKLYRFVEIDIDGIYKNLLLIKKKKYAGQLIKRCEGGNQFQLELELKGLDMVRRDWSQISAKASEIVLKEILSEKPFDERVQNIYGHMEKLRTDLEAMQIPKSMFEITKQITKDLKQYKTNVQSLPHVIVAMRLSQKKNYRKGDTVSYVICENGTQLPAVQRAYHLDELTETDATSSHLKLDTNYYLGQQIFPVVLRLCQPVHGIDLQKLAASLNVKDFVASKMSLAGDGGDGNQPDDDVDGGDMFARSQIERSFRLICAKCKRVKRIKNGFVQLTPFGDQVPFLLEVCTLSTDCGHVPLDSLSSLENQLRFTLNRYMSVYYRAPFYCSNLTCSIRTRIASNRFKNGSQIVCRVCRKGFLRPEITDEMLYDSLVFLKSLFTINEKVIINLDEDVIRAFNRLESLVDEYLNMSAYCVRDLKTIFAVYNQSAVSKFYQRFRQFYSGGRTATTTAT